MTDELSKSITQLKATAPKLNRATDEANAVVQLVENFLGNECSLGLTHHVCVSEESTGLSPADESSDSRVDRRTSTRLGYARVEGKFRIVVREDEDEYGTYRNEWGHADHLRTLSQKTTAWASCTRDVKLETLPKLPQLLNELSQAACSAVEKTDQATDAVKKILAALGATESAATKSGQESKPQASSRPASAIEQVVQDSEGMRAILRSAGNTASMMSQAGSVANMFKQAANIKGMGAAHEAIIKAAASLK